MIPQIVPYVVLTYTVYMYAPFTKLQPLFCCQKHHGNNLIDHPVFGKALRLWTFKVDQCYSVPLLSTYNNFSCITCIALQIMKLDDDVKMISAEAPVLFAKAAEMFITELTMRAWIHTEDNKRRTLQVSKF